MCQRTEIRGPISTPKSGIKDVKDDKSDHQKDLLVGCKSNYSFETDTFAKPEPGEESQSVGYKNRIICKHEGWPPVSSNIQLKQVPTQNL